MLDPKSIQARVQAGPLRQCEATYCERWTRDCLQPYCRIHRDRLRFHGHTHARAIRLKEIQPWRDEIEAMLKRLYATPAGFRTQREHQVLKGLAEASRFVRRWMDAASACWPCTAREQVAILATHGVKASEVVMRFLALIHYSRNTARVLGTSDEIRNAVGRTVLKCASPGKYHNSKRYKNLPVQDVRDVGVLMLDRFGRLAFYVSLLCEEYRAERIKQAEAPAEAETSIGIN